MDAKRASDRNYTVEFYRFFFCCAIYIMHIRNYKDWGTSNGVFTAGYRAVEFFFMLSGFFIAERCQREQESGLKTVRAEVQGVKYLISRYKRLMPQYLLSIAVLLLVNKCIDHRYSISLHTLDSFTEIIGCSIFWRSSGAINLHLWYVSGLIWAGSLAYYLLHKNKKFSLYVLFPLCLLLFMAYAYKVVGHTDITPTYKLRILAFFRSFAEIGLGCILYHIYVRIRAGRFDPAVMTVIETVLFAAVVIIMWRTRRDKWDFVSVVLMAALLLVTMLNQGYLSKLLNNRVSAALGAVSYPMYLNQRLFQNIARQVFPGLPFWPVVAVSILALMIYSLAVTWLLNWAMKQLSHLKRRSTA